MKRLLLILTALLLTFGFVFASPQQEEETPEKLVYITPSWGAPSEELVAAFEAQTGIKVEVSTMKDEDLKNKVMQAAGGKVNPADVIFVGISHFGTFGASGILSPLDGLAPQSLFDRVSGADFFEMDGATYAVPLYQQMVMVDYDKTSLEKIGMTAEDIQTWDDFDDAAVKMKAEGIYEYPLAFAVRHWSWYLIALSQGSTLFGPDGDPTFDDPSDPAYDAYKRLIGWYEKGLISPERLTSPNAHPSFWAGQAAFHQAWQGSLAIANNPEKSKTAPNTDYLVLPEEHYTWSLPAGLGISSYTKYPKAALQFIEFMLTEDAQMHGYEGNGMFPAEKSVFKSIGDQGLIDGWDAMSEQANYVVPLPYNTPWFGEFETELKDSLLRVARGEVEVEKSIADLAAFTRALQKEYE
ncbi:MAG: extracellular solute-binding protein [Spirochaetales bacterium]|nr:extracellular solute-binding protein [Spirochaetales bacterium]